MTIRLPTRWQPGRRAWWLLSSILLVAAAAGIGSACFPEWGHQAVSALAAWGGMAPEAVSDHDGHDHSAEADSDGHDAASLDDHVGEQGDIHAEGEHADEIASSSLMPPGDHKHVEAAAVNLSPTARGNVGLKLATVELRPFERTISVPAMVVERPGRSSIQVSAPLTGVVTRIWPLQGETVTAGQPLFDLKVMHEEVVVAQAEYLRTAEELDVVKRELARLEKVAEGGAIAAKTVLERQYELQKLEGVFRAQRQRLLLHGLSPAQVDQIAAERNLLAKLTIGVPEHIYEQGDTAAPHLLQIQDLNVAQGQYVTAGDPLCVLADHARLYIQGKAFEQDVAALEDVVNRERRVTAVVEEQAGQREMIPDLSIVYLANRVEPDSRSFLFYVDLPNTPLRNRALAGGHQFANWRFKPGQRMELLIPVERWTDRIVLPISAVVQDGPDTFVFEENEGHFDRRAVRVEYRDQYSAVIANDGTLQLGKQVIVSGAYQVHLSLKNKAGGAIDPHAGHDH